VTSFVQGASLRRPSLIVGAVLAMVGTMIVLVPGLATMIPGEQGIVTIAGGVALIAGYLLVRHRRVVERETGETGDPEVPLPGPTPGTELHEELQQAGHIGRIGARARRRLKQRLHEIATAVVRRREGVSQDTARRMIDRSEWTDDLFAASFLCAPGHEPDMSTRENLATVVSLRSRFSLEATRTAEAILEMAARADPSTSGSAIEEDLSPGPATDDAERPVDRETRRWSGVGALGLLSGGLGIAFSSPGLLLVSVVGVTYAAFSFQASPPEVDLAVERTLSPADGDAVTGGAAELETDGAGEVVTGGDSGNDAEGSADSGTDEAGAAPAGVDAGDQGDAASAGGDAGPVLGGVSPGEVVEVTLTVENASDETLSDCRLVDGVPPGLDVVEGSSRLGTALRPGRSATFTYAVEATRGTHEFGPMQVLARDASGAREREVDVDAPGTLACVPELEAAGTMPLCGTATRYTGRVSTETGGEGVEFYATRDYRPGDPPGRIDWNRHARTRELATLLFREERAASVVLLVDTREKAYCTPGPGERHAVDRSVAAAGRIFESLLAGGDRVGVASFGPRTCWVDPGAGNTHREEVRRTLASHPAFDYAPSDEPFLPTAHLADIRNRAPVDAQVVLFSPVTDGYIETAARRLQAYGHPITVVSPDVTADHTMGHKLAHVERQTRLNALREAGIRVVDWRPGEELAVALERAGQGWSG
jgi:uncharacterized repeat protein (TIGR01451 family)